MRATHSPRHALRRARPVGVVALLIYPRRTGDDVTVTIQADPRELPRRLALENALDDDLELFVLYDDSGCSASAFRPTASYPVPMRVLWVSEWEVPVRVLSGAERELRVRVTGGDVLGVREGAISAWRGIPYAAPPTGPRRFRAPGPVVPWVGTRDASRFGSIAPQTLRRRLRGAPPEVASDEDCLTVNVQSPSEVTTPLPVLVFIHGGGYSSGSSQEFSGRGESFVTGGRAVYVSFNYRLGPFGYLDFSRYSTPERPFESNLGLRDQVALLAWVRDNIEWFGGDPRNVTVFGESAGGNAVITLMATPAARGLFARAIAQSAPPSAIYERELTSAWAGEFVDILRRVTASRVADSRMGAAIAGAAPPRSPYSPYSPHPPEDIGVVLAEADVSDLLAAGLELQTRTPDAYPGRFCLAPVIDGDYLPRHPLAAIREGHAHRVPLIIGTNDREGSIFRGRVDILPRSAARIAAMFATAPVWSHDRMREAYPGLPSRRPAADFSGDYGFWYPSVVVADLHSTFAPVHVYRFDLAPRLLRLLGLDATHGVEMFALFDSLDMPIARAMTSIGGREEYSAAGERMRGYWLGFAEDGGVASSWPPYETRSRATLIIDVADRVENDPHRARRRAWVLFLPELLRRHPTQHRFSEARN
ncbi:carboxylesterase/lipase family protein [Leifsonia sp. NPDC058248]|uniref:carboxylesterase/lipase family protein n=1 Tax=Leifsonia sp. NPDC058248 TaxID=3346402 RepID=UPI0036D916E4